MLLFVFWINVLGWGLLKSSRMNVEYIYAYHTVSQTLMFCLCFAGVEVISHESIYTYMECVHLVLGTLIGANYSGPVHTTLY